MTSDELICIPQKNIDSAPQSGGENKSTFFLQKESSKENSLNHCKGFPPGRAADLLPLSNYLNLSGKARFLSSARKGAGRGQTGKCSFISAS
jgi:hypothetical protein